MPLELVPDLSNAVIGTVEYVWVVDGVVESKNQVIPVVQGKPIIERAATMRKTDSRQILSVVMYVPDPLRVQPSFIALCELRDMKDVRLPRQWRGPLFQSYPDHTSWWGFRQRYSFSTTETNPRDARLLADLHFGACVDAGIPIHGMKLERNEYEFKTGPRSIPSTIDEYPMTPLTSSDYLWLARHLLYRVASENNVRVRPSTEDASIYLSTEAMRKNMAEVERVAHHLAHRLPDAQIVDGNGRHRVRIRPPIHSTDHGCLEITGFLCRFDPYRNVHLLLDLLALEEVNSDDDTKNGNGTVPDVA